MKSSVVNAGDNANASQYDNLRNDAYGGSFLLPHQQTTANLTLKIEQGIAYIGNTRVIYAGGNTPSFTAPSTNPRIDIVTIDSSGTIAITQGTEAASPVAPAYPANKAVIAEVFNRVGETQIFDTDQGGSTGYIYNDVRGFVGFSYISAAAQIADGIISDAKIDSTGIVSANKVSGAAFKSLSSTPSGAGIMPIANLASGTPTGVKFIRDDGTLQDPLGAARSFVGSVFSQTSITTQNVDTTYTPGFTAKNITIYFKLNGAVGGSGRNSIGIATFNGTTLVSVMWFLENTNTSAISSSTANLDGNTVIAGVTTSNNNDSSCTLTVTSVTSTQFTVRAAFTSPTAFQAGAIFYVTATA